MIRKTKKFIIKYLSQIIIIAGGLSLSVSSSAFELSETEQLNNFIQEMSNKHKFDSDFLTTIFKDAKKQQTILDAISRPAESKAWYEYRPIFVTHKRIKGGKDFLSANVSILKAASKKYGIPAEIVVAIIGVETRYGEITGNYRVIDSLSTLAFSYPPRSKFFLSELQHYLLMTRDEKIDPLQQKGSYAGAMGIPQFMPSSFREYAVDFDGNGKRDLWSNMSDVIGSVSNYFKRHGWRKNEPIATKVKVYGKRYNELLSKNLKPKWSQTDLLLHGVALPENLAKDLKGTFIRLQTKNGPEYWVVWNNFYVITRYNNSVLYAMSVYQLSEFIREQNSSNKQFPPPAP